MRDEVFNAANHPNFAGPTSYFDTRSAGAISSTPQHRGKYSWE
jgi:hypothetical protein